MKLTHKYLLGALWYNKRTGHFKWKRNSPRRKRGDVAGSLHTHGYIHIKILNREYKGHRLAWFYVTGIMPEEDVEHKNLIKHDNKWKNLRLADDFLNQANTRLRINNTSGFKGVTRRPNGKWRVRVGSHNKRFHLGDFDDPIAGYQAYKKRAKELFGEFARV